MSEGAGDDAADWIRLLPVRVGEGWYAVESGLVAGVVAPESVTRVPHTAASVAGVARVRGETTVVVDLHAHLGDETPDGEERRVVVVRRGPEETRVGLAVDEVGEVETYPAAEVESAADAGVDETTFSAVVAGDTGTLPVFGVERIATTAVRVAES
jgi:chemotaxis signal transduction protein